MSSILSGYEYDVFISYRHNDNKNDKWVTDFVQSLKTELEATVKEDVSIYFDENPFDGLAESHDVDRSLAIKLKSLIFIPILSQTYCDPRSFAWQSEFLMFNRLANEDTFGMDIRLPNGNIAGRILPIQIHDIDQADISTFEDETKRKLRSIDFIYREPGVNRPLRLSDDNAIEGQSKVKYRNQINKVANAVKELMIGMKSIDWEGFSKPRFAAQVSDSLIRSVYDEIVKHKPSLAKHLILDEDDTEIDNRILADQIIKIFPWPIGVELRRLFSGTMRSKDKMRLIQLFKAIELTLRLTTFVLVIELLENVKAGKIQLTNEFRDDFMSRFRLLTVQNMTWLVRSIGRMLEESDTEYFMPEMRGSMNQEFFDALDFWLPERDETGIYRIELPAEEIEKKCEENQELLTFFLKNISYIVKYKLVNMREIKVLKNRHLRAKFDHFIDFLNGSEGTISIKHELLEDFSDSQAVLLMKNTRDPHEFLNLSPLIIDTRSADVEAKDRLILKKDVYLYNKLVNNELHYWGTEVTTKSDLTRLPNYSQLRNDFELILTTLGTHAIIVA